LVFNNICLSFEARSSFGFKCLGPIPDVELANSAESSATNARHDVRSVRNRIVFVFGMRVKSKKTHSR